VVERCPDKTEVLGPIPSTRTFIKTPSKGFFILRVRK